MARGVSWFFVAPLVLLGLSGCKFGLEQREPWRSAAEQRCLAEGSVKPSAYIQPMSPINGAGTCGMDRPFKISAFAGGTVEVAPKATLACPMTSSVDRWINEAIQPAAMAWFGQPVVKVKQMSSYSCRNMNGAKTGKISEHAFGNGLDVGGFVLADGREVLVKTGWKGRADEQGFLRTVQATACQRFSVVLAPGSNVYHYDHIHVDLMRRQSGKSTCKPAAVMPTPPNMPIFKAPPVMPGLRPVPLNRPSAPDEIETNPQEDAMAPAMPAPVAPAVASAAMAAPVSRAPAPAYPAPSYGPVGAPMPLTPPGGPSYGAYPAPAPAPAYPAQPYPPAQQQPVYSQPQPVYTQPQPVYSQPSYPPPSAPPAPPPARSAPPGIPLPPAGIPLAKWLGLDTTTTGSTGSVRSFTSERKFASPIQLPEAEAGED